MTRVWYVEATRATPAELLAAALDALWDAAGFDTVFAPGELAALKLHVGEPGRTPLPCPDLVPPLVRRIHGRGATPYLTDTAVLYRSRRDNAVDHARVAHEHGFSLEATGAPFLAADGLDGRDELEVDVDGRHYQTVAIASGIMHARSLLVLSHATGHLGTGLGAALKNLGMGCCSKKAKLRQHHGHQPSIDPDACTGCGTCAEWCPSDAIEVDDVAQIQDTACIGCGECIAACRDDAVRFGWGIMGAELSERIVEHAAAVVRSKPGKIAYVTSVIDVTKDCDCLQLQQRPLIRDLGLLAGHDPVALDQAALDLIGAEAGCSLESLSYPRRDAELQLRYAEEIGLGRRGYELVRVGVA